MYVLSMTSEFNQPNEMSEAECQAAVDFFKTFNTEYINKPNFTDCCSYIGRENYYFEDPGVTIGCGTTDGTDLSIRAM
jgi:hypothetical protein